MRCAASVARFSKCVVGSDDQLGEAADDRTDAVDLVVLEAEGAAELGVLGFEELELSVVCVRGCR